MLTSGTRLGTFEIQSLVGAGGMGEVYRARDTRLERTVALKVLPPLWADHVEMRQRFEREAQAIASLNHPHICTLHDIGRHQPDSGGPIDFLVMEYLEGETLADRLERGPLGLDEALRVAIAIADALDKAHRRGVTHRDLKPGNVFLVRGNAASDPPIAKLLDFGLAKLRGGMSGDGSGGARSSASALPTNRELTAHGSILGTLQYMAPEQLEGNEADTRTDIFAFGALVHEMVTGQKAFQGKSRVLIISAIATAEPPPLSASQPASPPALDHVVKTCLAKDPSDRWQTARDVLAELQWIAAGGADAALPRSAASSRRGRMRQAAAFAAAAVLVVAATMTAVLYLQPDAFAAQSRVRIPIQLTADAAQITNAVNFDGSNFAVAHDGLKLALVARSNVNEPLTIFVRRLGSVTPQKLPGTEDAAQLFWSADSRSIAFVAGGMLKRVEEAGGPPQPICEVTEFVGGDWNADGTIIFGTSRGLFRVPAQGGATPELLTMTESAESGHYWPHFLPDGRRFLYLSWASQAGARAIIASSLGSKERTKVMAAESKAAYARPARGGPGSLVFRRESAVFALQFDPDTLVPTGEPYRLADGIAAGGANGAGNFSVSRAGPLVYYLGGGGPGSSPQTDTAEWQLAWIDRTGTQLQAAGPPGAYRGAEVSQDGARIVAHKHEAIGGNIFVIESRGLTQLTFDAARHNSHPLWSSNGDQVVYGSLQKGKWGLYRTLSNGSGTEELLYESDLPKAPMSWSRDGKRLVFWVQDPKTAGDLWVLLVDEKKAEPFLNTPFNETHAQISYDMKWIAFASNSNDNRTEVYVKPFPNGPGIYRISRAGGDWPRWTRDSRELLFHAPGAGAFVSGIFLAPVDGTRGAFEATEAKELIRTAALNVPHSGGDYHTYSLSPDGKNLLIFQLVGPVGGVIGGQDLSPDPAFGLVAALNWTVPWTR